MEDSLHSKKQAMELNNKTSFSNHKTLSINDQNNKLGGTIYSNHMTHIRTFQSQYLPMKIRSQQSSLSNQVLVILQQFKTILQVSQTAPQRRPSEDKKHQADLSKFKVSKTKRKRLA